ncbi:hypothetical protein [Acetobacter okinawensis]|uniref:hypothetical protein n=1 Tax=Acetobacter okinawensis TaxID=1076594 RepID=UPI00214DA5CD|nr:hypothetical protein [Acetobacter okinawensis]
MGGRSFNQSRGFRWSQKLHANLLHLRPLEGGLVAPSAYGSKLKHRSKGGKNRPQFGRASCLSAFGENCFVRVIQFLLAYGVQLYGTKVLKQAA